MSAQHCATSLFNLIFPSDCRLCGDPLSNVSRLPVCDECLNSVHGFAGTQCTICGETMFSQHVGILTEPVCGICQRARPSYIKAVACGPYDGALRDLIHLLKYDRVRTAARPLGSLLAQQVSPLREQIGESAMILPVPLYRGKFLERGFNQSEAIARELASELCRGGWKVPVERDAMRRTRATVSQTGLTRHQRRANVRGAFAVKHRESIAGRNIILVDDVLTTGTTVQECARVLLRARASGVWVATAARVSKLSFANPRWQEVALAASGSAANA